MRIRYNRLYYQRIAITLIAAVMTLVLYVQGRHAGNDSGLAALSAERSGSIVVQVSGDVAHPGIYRICGKKMTIDAIFMAVPLCAASLVPSDDLLSKPLQTGDAVHLMCKARENKALISTTSMKTSQLLTLGLPLDLNTMSQADFELLPGIGPALAYRIVGFRQNNGDTLAFDDLLQVDGIGEKKLKQLYPYFNHSISK